MNCDSAKILFPEYFQKDLSAQDLSDLEQHLSVCSGCQKNKTQFKSLWSLMEPRPMATPQLLKEKTLNKVHQLIQKEAKGLNLWRLLAAFGIGLALATFCISSLGHQVSLKGFSFPVIASCISWWAGLFVLSCAITLGRYKIGKLRLGFLTSTATASIALLMLGTYFYPKLELLSQWLASDLGSWLSSSIGLGSSHLIFGFMIALVPTFLAALYFGRGVHRFWIMHGVGASLVFLALLLPNLYIQCCFVPFTLASLLVAGVALGGASGILGALGLNQRFPQSI